MRRQDTGRGTPPTGIGGREGAREHAGRVRGVEFDDLQNGDCVERAVAGERSVNELHDEFIEVQLARIDRTR